MASESRPANPPVTQRIVINQIRTEPWNFSFFQVVRWMTRVMPHRDHVGKFYPPFRELARFHANPVTAFPASEVQGLEWREDEPLSVTVNFMGLFGPMGALPLYYSEYIRGRLRMRPPDSALPAFLDMFNHRMVSLFYQAWEKYRFYVAYERNTQEPDRFSRYLLDLMGLGTPGLQNRLTPVRDVSAMFYTGLLSLLPRSALALEQILSDYFDVPIEVEQFMGLWYPLEINSQCKFDRGESYAEQLAVGVIVGDEVFDPQSGIRIRVGPLTLTQYLDFLPEGTAFKPLKSLIRFFTNDELTYEVQLVLKRQDVPRLEMGALGEAGPRLGWVTWMKNDDMNRDPDETTLRV